MDLKRSRPVREAISELRLDTELQSAKATNPAIIAIATGINIGFIIFCQVAGHQIVKFRDSFL